MRGQGIKYLFHDDGLWHPTAFDEGFFCLQHSSPLTIEGVIRTLYYEQYIRLTPTSSSRNYDNCLDDWRMSLCYNYQTEDQMCMELDYSIAYLMHGEPRAHGCLDSGL